MCECNLSRGLDFALKSQWGHWRSLFCLRLHKMYLLIAAFDSVIILFLQFKFTSWHILRHADRSQLKLWWLLQLIPTPKGVSSFITASLYLLVLQKRFWNTVSFIWTTCDTHPRWILSSMFWMLKISHVPNISTFDILSCHSMLQMLSKQTLWKVSRYFICLCWESVLQFRTKVCSE